MRFFSKRKNPTPQHRNIRAESDAGMVTNFRHARYEKPEKQGFLKRLVNAWRREFGKQDPQKTTQEGSLSASPTQAWFELFALRYEHREKVADTRAMYEDDFRAHRAVDMYCREAVRDGVSILVNERATRGLPASWQTKAKKCAKLVETMVNPQLEGFARMLFVEGDLFAQAIFDSEEKLCGVCRMPATTMEPITDTAGNFTDLQRAYEQIDVMTQEHIAFFSEAAMLQLKWNAIPGEKFGFSGLLPVRRQRRLLLLMEEAQVLRRITRAPQRVVFNLGTQLDPSPPEIVKKFRDDNGYIEGALNPYDIMNTALDYWGDGRLSATPIIGDPSIDEIQDLEYYQDGFAAGLPTPSPLYNLASKSINTDTVEHLRAEWLKETKAMTAEMDKLVRWLMDMALLQEGILPHMLTYETHFSESSIEEPSTIIDNICNMRSNTVGQGNTSTPDPLISQETAIGLLREYTGIKDVNAEIKLLEQEREKRYEQQLQSMQANVTGRVGQVNPDEPVPNNTNKPNVSRPRPNTRFNPNASNGNGHNKQKVSNANPVRN